MSELDPEQELELLVEISHVVDARSQLDLKVFTDQELKTITSYHQKNAIGEELTREEAEVMQAVFKNIEE